jgi:type II secretory pathway predicted ATPase ExeA
MMDFLNMRKNRTQYVNASEIGIVTQCPLMLYNKVHSKPTSQRARERMQYGTNQHKEFTQQVIKNQRKQFWFVRLLSFLFGWLRRK